MPLSVREYCLSLLRSGDLATKLAPPRDEDGRLIEDHAPGPPIHLDQPARDAGLEMRDGAPRLPRPNAIESVEARVTCMARFAHHELMAAELFAWALLRWPDAPVALRRGWLGALEEEQLHCRLYLDRLVALGSRFEEHVHSDYFWKQAPAIARSEQGARAFLAAMGLTLEQANLDFTAIYRDAFRAVGDEASAAICDRIQRDEIGHVRLAAEWLLRLAPEGQTDAIRAYEGSVPFPLAASRAKGRRFDADARRRAGLDEAFIEYVRSARSSQQTRRPSPAGGAPRPRPVAGDATGLEDR